MSFRDALSERPNRGFLIHAMIMTIFSGVGLTTIALPHHASLGAAFVVVVLVAFWVLVIVGIRRDWFIAKEEPMPERRT